MSEKINTTEQTTQATTTENETTTVVPETVSKTAYDQVSGDMHKYKDQNRTLQTEKTALEKKIKDSETQGLANNEEFKQLWENEKVARESAEVKLNDFKDDFFSDKRISAVRQAAIKLNMREEALDDLDMLDLKESVVIEKTDRGNTIIHGADEFVTNLQKLKPHWFTDSKAPNINTANPGVTTQDTKLSPADVLKLQKTDPVKYKEAILKMAPGKS